MIKRISNKILRKFGYSPIKGGLNYINAKNTIEQAKKRKLTICEYLESTKDDKRKIGRRDRIINMMESLDIFSNAKNICEIGTGTGMYLEKIIKKTLVQTYEVYETAIDWKEYLNFEYKTKIKHLILHDADGITLRQTRSATIDLVHAHAVFVYIPFIDIYNYLKECVRICKKEGYIVFDAISDDKLNVEAVQKWSNINCRFAVITPHKFILDFIKKNNLILLNSFNEVYGGTCSKYYILQKK